MLSDERCLMDKETRSAIESATQKARRLLTEDFQEQLDATFDVRADGRVALEPGAHLDAQQRRLRRKIVAAIEHKMAAGMKPSEAVADYLRDAAFTVVNRFVALKMLEARELVQTCISQGDASPGFIEFCGLAPGVRTPDGAGYQLYLECIFDELSTEVKVLFDRRDPASALWPRRAVFDALLEVLNAPALAGVWAEDETIGWVYQYFNGQDERRKMREESQAPRNSRELAVRNQFFTPRYVVQFLTDNTLGRIWYEMRDGDTALAEACEYRVRRPDETWAPRPKKDPRDLRVLDPACGSGHFLLYAFDLLATIYEEAWGDLESPASEATGRTIRADYLNLEELRRALPGLILGRNLYGVDIDPRCAQIAQLALWMRAQRAFRDFGMERDARHVIRRSNIVIAEPMPGEADLRDEFLRGLAEERLVGLIRRALDIPPDRPVRATQAMAESLRDLLERVWDAMSLAGEMGVLLRVERTLASAVERGRGDWEEKLPLFRAAEYGLSDERPAVIGESDGSFISGEEFDFWNKSELIVLRALEEYAAEATGFGRARRRLFADDAAHGFALADLVSKKFDVILMNPPFGDPPANAKKEIFKHYNSSKTELYACFLERAVELSPFGMVGMLSSRTGYFLSSMESWRRDFLLGASSSCNLFVDLGEGILDAAVECVATVVGGSGRLVLCADASSSSDEAVSLGLVRAVLDRQFVAVPIDQLLSLPGATFAFGLPSPMRNLFGQLPSLRDRGFVAKQGIGTSDNFRFLRLRWEVDPEREAVSPWMTYAKGGAFSPMHFSSNLLLRWGEDGAEVKAYSASLYGSWSKQITNTQFFMVPGLTYSSRTHRELAPSLMIKGAAFDTKGCCVFCEGEKNLDQLKCLMGIMNSRMFAGLLRVGLSRVSPGLARQYTESLVVSIPVPDLDNKRLRATVSKGIELQRRISAHEETSEAFDSETWLSLLCESTGIEEVEAIRVAEREVWSRQSEIAQELEDCVISLYFPDGCPGEVASYLDKEIGVVQADVSKSFAPGAWGWVRSSPFFGVGWDEARSRAAIAETLCSLAFGKAIGRWSPHAAGRGILVDDVGHPRDLLNCIGDEGKEERGNIESIVALAAGGAEARSYFSREFFESHLRRYSSDKRKAPIYWQLATPSVSYSVWLFISAFARDTLFRVQNDYVAPKLAHEQRQLDALRAEAGPSPTAAQGRAIEAQAGFVEELSNMLDEVRRVAPLWNPKLDDGVIINFAPLWRLVPQNRAWQKELRATWDELAAGKYDWAHLAMRLWPERVVPKCAKDRSLAIAHGVEDLFWSEGADGKWAARPTPTRRVEDLIAERTSSAVQAALKSLLEAPEPTGGVRKRNRAKA